jgi:Bacterial Ig domain/Bacterial Ig-like domain (group 1)
VTRLSILGFTCLAAVTACGGNDLVLPGEGEPAHIRIVQGSPQSGRVGETLGDSLVVEVTDVNEHPVPGITVVFQLTGANPGTQLLPDTAITGTDGQAGSQVVLGTEVGDINGIAQVVASGTQSPIPANFIFTALPASANGLSVVSGDNQSAPAGAALPAPLIVKVTDAFGNPVSGVTITWATVGGGSLSASSTQTGADGQTSVQLTLGTTAGLQTVTASAEGLAGSPLTFNLTATPGTASGISIVSGDGQTGAVGAPLTAALVVKVADGSGNPVIGATVTWAVTAGGGSPNPASSTTDANGQAATIWTLGPTPSTNTLTASVAGVGTVTFTATGVSGAPSQLAILTQPSQTARIGTPFARQPVIQVRDGQGNDVAQSGVSVTAAVALGAGTLGGTATRVTDAQGRATFTDLQINGAGGAHTLIFAAAGYTSVTSTSINVKVPTTATIVSDQPDPSAPNAAVTVTFTVTSIAGTPTGTVQVTVSGGAETCSAAVSAGSCSITLITTGNRTLTASYPGDAIFDPSSDTEPHQVVVPNSPPNSNDDAYSTTEDIPQFSVAAPGVLGNDTDPDGNALQAEKLSDPANGTVTLNANGGFVYTPNANFFGDDSFTYRAKDATSASSPSLVRITVQPVNDPPSFQIGTNQSASANAPEQTVADFATAISAGPNETQGLQFLVTVTSGAEFLSVAPAISPTGTLTYTPSGTQGTATISVQLKDDGGTANGGSDISPAQTFTITVGP